MSENSEQGKPQFLGLVRGRLAAEQRARLTAEAQRRGWHLVDVIAGGEYSVDSALQRIEREQLAGLVVTDLTRLTRSPDVADNLLREAAEHGWTLVILDAGTPAGAECR